jgi:hypothetical protein
MISKNTITFYGTQTEFDTIGAFVELLETVEDDAYDDIEKITKNEKTFYDKVRAIFDNFKVE